MKTLSLEKPKSAESKKIENAELLSKKELNEFFLICKITAQ